MRLKSLDLVGFKSFLEPTSVGFASALPPVSPGRYTATLTFTVIGR